jgi:phosphinothricin acetyltransferase
MWWDDTRRVEFCEYMGQYPHATIRALAQEDMPNVRSIYAHYVEHSSYTFEYEAPSLDTFSLRCLGYGASHGFLVLHYQNQLAGYAYGCRFRDRAAYQWTAETSIYLSPKYCGLGLSEGLYANLLQILKDKGFESAIGVITLPNAPSMALHKKMGFELRGQIARAGHKHGNWHDIALVQIMLDKI